MSTLYSFLARAASRYRWWFVGVWLVVLAISAVGARGAEHSLKVGGFSIPGTEFNTSSEIIARDLDFSTDKVNLAVFHSETLFVTDKPFYDAVQRARTNLSTDPNVSKVECFYDVGIPDWVSPNNHTTYCQITLKGTEQEMEEATPRLRDQIRSNDVEVSLIGQPATFYDTQKASAEDLARVESITFPIVFVLLVLVFGSLVAAFVPIVLGVVCVVVSLAVLYVISQFTDLSIFALNTASMIGLGLAIDFSLMMVSRFREEMEHSSVEEALDRTMQTAGRSITFSGITLMLTMSVLTLFPVMIIRSIALSIVVVAAVAVLAALLLLPAILALLNRRLNSLNMRRFIPGLNRRREGAWRRWAYAVMARPWTSIAIALLILGVLALPVLQLERTGATVRVLPQSSESRRAADLMEREFGPSEITPIIVVVQAGAPGGLWQPEVMQGVYELHTRMQGDPRVRRVQSLMSLVPNPSPEFARSLSQASLNNKPDWRRIAVRLANLEGENTTTAMLVYTRKTDTDKETVGLMKELRESATVWAPGLASTRVLVGGSSAQHYDFDKVVYDPFPLLLSLSLLVTFVILMLFFHSLILPIKAILLNIVSILASYGILVLIFQYGYGDSLLGFESLGALISYTPVLLFSILFGLSTDYEVFLLTRVREYYLQGKSNEESVALGLEHTAGIITAAGLIMIAVFGSFALTGVLVIKELGFGLAVAVLIDTTLVRVVLVPASMKLMGAWNWWMPKALDRLVPEIDEGDTRPTSRPAARPAGGD